MWTVKNLDAKSANFRQAQRLLGLMVIYYPKILLKKELFDICLEWISDLNNNDNFYVNNGARQVLLHFLKIKKKKVIIEDKIKRTLEDYKNESTISLSDVFNQRFKSKIDDEKYTIND
jgi:hypothetical protein